MFDIKETGLYDKWISEALNFGTKMNGGTDQKWEKENEMRS
jgi:hypothetical protein